MLDARSSIKLPVKLQKQSGIANKVCPPGAALIVMLTSVPSVTSLLQKSFAKVSLDQASDGVNS